jgi:hypothetical protein
VALDIRRSVVPLMHWVPTNPADLAERRIAAALRRPSAPAIRQHTMPSMPRIPRRRFVRPSLSLASLALVMTASLAAQAPTRVTGSNSGLWLQYYGNYHFAPRWALAVGGQLRRANFVSEAEQTWLQLGLGYDATKGGGVIVGAGYVYLRTYPYGVFPAATDFSEHRAWQQLTLNSGLGQVKLEQRFQLEQRWIADVFSWRARSLFRGTIPFHKRAIRPGDFYAALADEVFVGFGSNIGLNLFNQNRASVLLGRQFGGGFHIETGYMNQIVAKGANGNEIEINHVLIVALYHSANLR